MSAEAEILSSRLDRLEQAASEDHERIKVAAELLHKLSAERETWAENDKRLNDIEKHLTAHCAEIDDIVNRLDGDDIEFDEIDGQLNRIREIQFPTPLCPHCGGEMHWARYANDKPYLRCPDCGKTCLPPVLQPD